MLATSLASLVGMSHRLALSQTAGSKPPVLPISFAKPTSTSTLGFSLISTTQSGPTPARSGRLLYGYHHVRIDQGDRTSAIVDLRTGEFTLLVHAARAFARVSVEQMKAQRAAARKRTLDHIETLPPRTRALIRAQMRAQDKALTASIRLQTTQKTATVDGRRCRIATWTSPQEQGEACIASDGPVDLAPFMADARAFQRRLREAGLGSGALALPILLLAPHGLAVRLETTVRLGTTEIRSSTTYRELRTHAVAAGDFRPPPGYQQTDLAALTAGGQAP